MMVLQILGCGGWDAEVTGRSNDNNVGGSCGYGGGDDCDYGGGGSGGDGGDGGLWQCWWWQQW